MMSTITEKEIEIFLNQCSELEILFHLRDVINERIQHDQQQLLKENGNILKERIRSRLKNYKHWLPSVKKFTGLKIDDNKEFIDQKYNQIIDGYSCPGVANNENACAQSCPEKMKLKYLTEFKSWIFDHYYRQEQIQRSLNSSLDYIIEKFPKKWLDDLSFSTTNEKRAYLKKEWNKQYNERVYLYLKTYFNFEKYVDDLFGTNLIIRCIKCEQQSTTLYPKFQLLRYVNFDIDIEK